MRRLVICIAATAVLLGSAASAPPSDAKSLGPSGRIVFVRHDWNADTRTVFLVDPDGTNPHELSFWTAEFFQPRWSPDGTEVNIAGDACGVIHVLDCATVIVDPDTGRYRWLPAPHIFFECADPCYQGGFGCTIWSPDGSLFACAGSSEADPSVAGMYTVRSSDGGDLTRILRFDPLKHWRDFPAPRDFSPDGHQLLYEQAAGLHRSGLFLIDLDGSDKRRVTPEGLLVNHDEEASFSPEGDWILFGAFPDENHRRTIYLIRPDGTGFHEVFPQCGGSFAKPRTTGCGNASWSPDGTRIVFQMTEPRGNGGYSTSIKTTDPDGTNVQTVLSHGPAGTTPEFPDWGMHPPVPEL